jgi:Family of unknown function (DUF6547)
MDDGAAIRGLIDGLLKRVPSIDARLVREEGIFSRAADHLALNSLPTGLSAPQRETLAAILDIERRNAIFDTLAYLNERLDIDGWTLSKDERPVEHAPDGYGFHEIFLDTLMRHLTTGCSGP